MCVNCIREKNRDCECVLIVLGRRSGTIRVCYLYLWEEPLPCDCVVCIRETNRDHNCVLIVLGRRTGTVSVC